MIDMTIDKKYFGRTLLIPALLMLGACCSEKEVAVAPVTPPPPAPVVDVAIPVPDIYFDFDRSVITPAAQSEMKTDAKWLAANADRTAIVEGHCDERGTAEYNMALGERRAASAKDYLVGLGVDPARLQTVSYGSERPVEPGHNEAAWSKNRRVHFNVK